MVLIDHNVIQPIITAEEVFAEKLRNGLDGLQDTSEPQEALKDLCDTAQAVILADLASLPIIQLDAIIWTAHVKLNTLYRSRLNKLRATCEKPVETRKHIKLYLEFLKNSTRWYRNLITILSKSYGILGTLTQLVSTDNASPITIDPSVENHLELVSYHSLVHLGDLSRWRVVEKLDKNPLWGPVVGYYDLAILLKSSIGWGLHQRSLVETTQKNAVKGLYYLYRSLTAVESYETAVPNLLTQIKLLLKQLDKEGNLSPTHESDTSRKSLISWFLRLHAVSFSGQKVQQYSELMIEILHSIAICSSRPDNASLFTKLAIINISAEYRKLFDLQHLEDIDSVKCLQAFYNYQQLSLRTFTALLEAATRGLSTTSRYKKASQPDNKSKSSIEPQYTSILKAVLPALRVYITWLLIHYKFILPDKIDPRMREYSVQFWHTLIDTLHTLFVIFPIHDLPELDYLLEEDLDMQGSSIFDAEITNHIRSKGDVNQKPTIKDRIVIRLDPEMEMLARIRTIQLDGLRLAAIDDVPLTFADGNFHIIYSQTVAMEVPLEDPRFSKSDSPILDMSNAAQPRIPADHISDDHLLLDDTTMSAMVDQLLGADDSAHPSNNIKVTSNSRNPSRGLVTSSATDDGKTLVSSFDPTPPSMTTRGVLQPHMHEINEAANQYNQGFNSPLLFGGSKIWSTSSNVQSSSKMVTPPNGQGR